MSYWKKLSQILPFLPGCFRGLEVGLELCKSLALATLFLTGEALAERNTPLAWRLDGPGVGGFRGD